MKVKFCSNTDSLEKDWVTREGFMLNRQILKQHKGLDVKYKSLWVLVVFFLYFFIKIYYTKLSTYVEFDIVILIR